MLVRKQPTHVRFEPEVEGGTTFAFNFQEGQLVVGPARLWNLIRLIETSSSTTAELAQSLVGNDAEGYTDAFSLYVDITRLLDAGVIEGIGDTAEASV